MKRLDLPAPEFNLDVGSGSHAEQTGLIMTGIEKVLIQKKPEVVLVQGDTNTVLAGTLAASKCYVTRGSSPQPIDVGHVEAGLRSFDRAMPEEVNRIIADHLSRYLFAPTEKAQEHLLSEGIPQEKIHVTGNTIVDAVRENLRVSKKRADTLKDLGLSPDGYFLVTLHRQENVDNKNRFRGILEALTRIHEEHGMPLVFPVHPRTEKMIESFGLKLKGFQLIKPLGFLEFLQSGIACTPRPHGFRRRTGRDLYPQYPVRDHPRYHRTPGNGGCRGKYHCRCGSGRYHRCSRQDACTQPVLEESVR